MSSTVQKKETYEVIRAVRDIPGGYMIPAFPDIDHNISSSFVAEGDWQAKVTSVYYGGEAHREIADYILFLISVHDRGGGTKQWTVQIVNLTSEAVAIPAPVRLLIEFSRVDSAVNVNDQ